MRTEKKAAPCTKDTSSRSNGKKCSTSASKKKPFNAVSLGEGVYRLATHEITGMAVGSLIAGAAALPLILQKAKSGSAASAATIVMQLAGKEITLEPRVCAGVTIAALLGNTWLMYRLSKRHYLKGKPEGETASFSTMATRALRANIAHYAFKPKTP